mgnify:CR=1 FL=1
MECCVCICADQQVIGGHQPHYGQQQRSLAFGWDHYGDGCQHSRRERYQHGQHGAWNDSSQRESIHRFFMGIYSSHAICIRLLDEQICCAEAATKVAARERVDLEFCCHCARQRDRKMREILRIGRRRLFMALVPCQHCICAFCVATLWYSRRSWFDFPLPGS